MSIQHGVPENHFIDALSGLAFLAGGIVALDRRPGNAIGPLMIAYVFVSYLGNWGNLEVPVLPLLGVGVGQWAGAPILAQIALSYPTGQLRTTFDRVVIGLIWAGAAVLNVVILLVFDPRSSGCTGCAWEPAPFPSRAAFTASTAFYQRAGAVLALLFLLAIWLRFRRATLAERRFLTPLWVAVCVIALVYLMGAFASPFPLADPFGYVIWELQGVLQISLPVIFVWGAAVGPPCAQRRRRPGSGAGAPARPGGAAGIARPYPWRSLGGVAVRPGGQEPLGGFPRTAGIAAPAGGWAAGAHCHAGGARRPPARGADPRPGA